MSVPYDGLAFPEFVVMDVLEATLASLLDDPVKLDRLLAGRPSRERDSIRTALQIREGKVRLGWGNLPQEDWMIVVALQHKAPDRGGRTIGDTVSGPAEEPIATAVLEGTISNQPDVVLPLGGGAPEGLSPRGRVRIGEEQAIYEVVGSDVVLRTRGILETEAVAHLATELAVFHGIAQRVGWSALSSIRVDILASESRFAITLAGMLVADLVLGRDRFEAQGATLHEIEETDLAPRSPQFPEGLVHRTLMLKVRTEVSLPEPLPVITGAEQDLTVEGVDGNTRPAEL